MSPSIMIDRYALPLSRKDSFIVTTLDSSHVLNGQFQKKLAKSCEKDVKKMLKFNQKLFQVALVRSKALLVINTKNMKLILLV